MDASWFDQQLDSSLLPQNLMCPVWSMSLLAEACRSKPPSAMGRSTLMFRTDDRWPKRRPRVVIKDVIPQERKLWHWAPLDAVRKSSVKWTSSLQFSHLPSHVEETRTGWRLEWNALPSLLTTFGELNTVHRREIERERGRPQGWKTEGTCPPVQCARAGRVG